MDRFPKVNYSMADLPKEANEGNRWQGMLIPTLLKYLGTLANPWGLLPLTVIQLVWNRIYDTDEFGTKLSHTFTHNDKIHFMACLVCSPFFVRG